MNKNKTELGLEEEKKEGSPRRAAQTALEILQESPPKEIQGVMYDDDGIRGVARAAGHAAVEEIQHQFQLWANDQAAVFVGLKEADVYYMKNHKKDNKRCPDFAIWGPDCLNQRGRVLSVQGKKVNPHVIFQFSWGNSLAEEKSAIDDMSLISGKRDYEDLKSPNVLYLIKTIPKGESPVHGFDVYEVRRRQRLEHPTFTYHIGGDENLTIEVATGFVSRREQFFNFACRNSR